MNTQPEVFSIGFEFELNEELLVEDERDINLIPGTRTKASRDNINSDSTPAILLHRDLSSGEYKMLDNLAAKNFGVGRGTNKVKFDYTVTGDMLEFESKPIFIGKDTKYIEEFNNFADGIVETINTLKVLKDVRIKSESKEVNYKFSRYFTPKIKRRLELLGADGHEGTPQVTYGIPLNKYSELLKITPFNGGFLRLENNFEAFISSIVSINTSTDVRLNFFDNGYMVSPATPTNNNNTYIFRINPGPFSDGDAREILNIVRNKGSKIYNFLFLIHNYAARLGFKYSINGSGPVVNYGLDPTSFSQIDTGLKGVPELMLRNKFSDIYKYILDDNDKRLFKLYTKNVLKVWERMKRETEINNLNSARTERVLGVAIGVGYANYFPMMLELPLTDATEKRKGYKNTMLLPYTKWLLSIQDPVDIRKEERREYYQKFNHVDERVNYKINLHADLLSPPLAYELARSKIGNRTYAMGAYAINANHQILFECRSCMRSSSIDTFKSAGESIVESFAVHVAGMLETHHGRGNRRRKRYSPSRIHWDYRTNALTDTTPIVTPETAGTKAGDEERGRHKFRISRKKSRKKSRKNKSKNKKKNK